MNNGFILLHRKIIKEWEWYSNVNDRLVFIHCLLSANWEDGWFEGVKIPRGSFATSYKNLAEEIGISVHQLRTSLNHLKLTNNVAHISNRQFSIITINNYNKYQLSGTQDGKRVANEWQTSGNNIINNNKEKKYIYVDEFDKLWDLYPKKEGKSVAKTKYFKYRKEGVSYETILEGLNNYLAHIKNNGIERQYIKNGSTWFNQKCWEDVYEEKKEEPRIKQVREGVFEF